MPGRPSDAEIELLRAAEGGDREAMHALGEWYLEQFDEGHFRNLLDPATLGEPISERDKLVLESQARLTEEERDHYVAQRGVRDQALRWLRAAAALDDLEACVLLADFLSRSGDEALKSEALTWYERAANLGDSLSMATLGRLLKQGWGAPANREVAAAWYAKAAAAFEEAAKAEDEFAAVAMSELAKQLLAGDGVARDPTRAITLYDTAAARGKAATRWRHRVRSVTRRSPVPPRIGMTR